MLEGVIEAAVRAGGLVRFEVTLEEGQLIERQLWIRPEINLLFASNKLDATQQARAKAALKRFVVGGRFTVVTKDCHHREVANIGDIRELKGIIPPFLELRFKPPKHDLRFFGRCIGKDRLILTSYGMKNLTNHTHERPLSVPEHRKRCDGFFELCGLKQVWVPRTMVESFSEVELI
jgi:hypothetical protein